MFKPARWWSEKNKLKVVFKLQFHASQVTDVGGDELMISIVPADSGKSTVKSDKATVVDGNCYWVNPVYETVKFNQDPKSGKIHERIYHFALATGTSKSCVVVGEASIDFSSYAQLTKVSSVSLPLKNSKNEATLHVSIQRMHESMDQREVKESENVELCFKDHSMDEGTITSNPIEETTTPFNKNVKRRASSVSDITITSSDGSSVIETPCHEITQMIKNDDYPRGLKPDVGPPKRAHKDQRHSSWELSSTSDESSDIVIVGLKSDLAALSRRAETSDLETQNLRKQIAKEAKRGQDLWKEVICLRDERDSLKQELKSRTSFRFEGVDIEELREELNHEKELNSNLRIQLLKTQESNNELILAVRDLDEILEKQNKEKSDYSHEDDEEQKALEELVNGNYEDATNKGANDLERQVLDLRNEIEMYKRDRDELEAQMEQLALDYEIAKQANHEMSCKLEQSKIKEQLQMDDNECSSSSSEKNELDNYIENLESRTKELEAHVKGLEEELEKQALGFEADLEAITRSKIEQEQRAIKAEEILKKMRWKNANTAERLQEEFRRLSVQMGSTFEANERLAMKALAEANELRLEKIRLEELVRKKSEEILIMRDENETLEAKNKILLEEIEDKKKLVCEIERMRLSIKEMELKVEQGNDEVEDSCKELNKMGFILKEKELIIEKMESEIDSLRSLCDEVKHSLLESEKEKENLRKQVFELRSDHLKKREVIISSKPVLRGNTKDVVNLRERIKLLEGEMKLKESAIETSAKAFSDKENDLVRKIEELEVRREAYDELKNEMELVKEKNKSMEGELKEMEERYSEMSLKFAEVEGERPCDDTTQP